MKQYFPTQEFSEMQSCCPSQDQILYIYIHQKQLGYRHTVTESQLSFPVITTDIAPLSPGIQFFREVSGQTNFCSCLGNLLILPRCILSLTDLVRMNRIPFTSNILPGILYAFPAANSSGCMPGAAFTQHRCVNCGGHFHRAHSCL